jgi:hypothetical protein
MDPSINAALATEAIKTIQAVEEQAVEGALSIPALESSVQAAHFADKAVEFGLSGAEATVSILAVEPSSKAKPSADTIECILAMETGAKAEDTGGNLFAGNEDEGTIPSSNTYNNMPQSTIRSLPAKMICLGEREVSRGRGVNSQEILIVDLGVTRRIQLLIMLHIRQRKTCQLAMCNKSVQRLLRHQRVPSRKKSKEC